MIIRNFLNKKQNDINCLWKEFDNNPEFKLLFNSMSEGIVVQDENGVIIQNNPAALEILVIRLLIQFD